MPAHAAIAGRTQQKSQRELEDLQLVMRVRNGDERARDLHGRDPKSRQHSVTSRPPELTPHHESTEVGVHRC